MEVSLVRASLVNEPGNCGDIIPIVYELTKRTHEKHVRRLGTIIQSIFCAQSGASIHLTVWKWSGESKIKYYDFIPFFDFQYEKIIFNRQPSHFSPCSAVPV